MLKKVNVGIIAAVAIFLITYLFDIQAQIAEINTLQADVDDLHEQINIQAYSPEVSEQVLHRDVSPDMSSILKFIDGRAVNFESEGSKQYKLEIDLNDMEALSQLFDALNDMNQYFITHINVTKNEENKIHLSVNFQVETMGSQKRSAHQTLSSLPWCKNKMMKPELLDQVLHYPLQEITLLGVLEKEKVRSVLIKFPNGVTRTMHYHERLGTQKGLITDISADSFVVTLPNNQLMKFKLAERTK